MTKMNKKTKSLTVQLLNYLREHFEETLKMLNIDIIVSYKDYFEIDYPTFIHNGTGFFRVFPLPDGSIRVVKSYGDESFKDDEEKILSEDIYVSIDGWMKTEFNVKPTHKKSKKRLNYRYID